MKSVAYNNLRAAQGPSLLELAAAPIGVFDSGIGGLSVWRHLRDRMPHENFIYVADNANVPYGDKSEEWIQKRMVQMFNWFLAQGCKAIVIACNTATAAAATHLRGLFPNLFIVGLEPAIKPALALTKNHSIAMLATARTVKSAKYEALLKRTVLPELGIKVQSIACIGLAEKIDNGEVDAPETIALINAYLEPVKNTDVDVVVLGCTHYPFVAQHIRAVLDKSVQVIDSGAPVARYTLEVLEARDGLNPQKEEGFSHWYATFVDSKSDSLWRFLSGQVNVQVQQIIVGD